MKQILAPPFVLNILVVTAVQKTTSEQKVLENRVNLFFGTKRFIDALNILDTMNQEKQNEQ